MAGPARDIGGGATYLRRGWELLRPRPRLFLLGIAPALIVWLVLASAFVLMLVNLGDLTSWLTPFADDWSDTVRGIARFCLGVAIVVGSVMLFTATFTGLTLTVGDPFYERIWRACEDALGPVKLGEGLGFWKSMADAFKLAVVGVLSTIAVIVSGFIPIVGPLLGITLGLVFSGRLLARELVSRPLEARGMDQAAQRALLAPHRRTLLGFGVATQACFFVPLGGVLVMPIAVAGATALARDVLPDERGPAFQ